MRQTALWTLPPPWTMSSPTGRRALLLLLPTVDHHQLLQLMHLSSHRSHLSPSLQPLRGQAGGWTARQLHLPLHLLSAAVQLGPQDDQLPGVTP